MFEFVFTAVNALGRSLNHGKPFSRKLVTAFLVYVLAWAVAFAVSKGVFHVPEAVLAYVPAVIGVAAGAVSGWLAKEDPTLFSA